MAEDTPHSTGRGQMPPLRINSQTPASTSLRRLPPELRSKVWQCAIEPRIVLLEDLVTKPKAYPLPTVAALNVESRHETRTGYQRAGLGSYINFSKDLLVCDDHLVEQTSSNPAVERVASRAEHVVFWDCIPDDGRAKLPDGYHDYLNTCYHKEHFGRIDLDKFWFPVVKEFWTVKVGEIDHRWMLNKHIERRASRDVQSRQSAKEFRYWWQEGVVEMCALDLDDSIARLILRDGRCHRDYCRETNSGLSHLISKVSIMDGRYKPSLDGRKWVQIRPSSDDLEPMSRTARANLMRWEVVERVFTFLLRWDWPSKTRKRRATG